MVFLSLLIYKHSVAKYMHFVQNTEYFFQGLLYWVQMKKGIYRL